jgi:hypothetical protein
MNTGNFPGGKGRAARGADSFTICEPIVKKMWQPRRLTTLWAFMACYRDSFTFYFKTMMVHECFIQYVLPATPINVHHIYKQFKGTKAPSSSVL